jgi:hypothetical protein
MGLIWQANTVYNGTELICLRWCHTGHVGYSHSGFQEAAVMVTIALKVLLCGTLVLLAVYYAGGAFRNARTLNARIEELKRDQEERRKRGDVSNPYAELAELYAEQERDARKR